MRPYVVIEGPDGSGKTTLAEAFRREGMGVSHCGPPTRPALSYYLDVLAGHPDGWAALDRFHAGSFVYGTVFRGGDDLDWHERWLIESELLAASSLMIYANPPREAIDRALSRGPDDDDARVYEDPARRDEVRRMYDVFMSEVTALPVLEYDFTAPGALDRAVADAISVVDHLSEGAAGLGGARAFGNVYSPEVCLFGAAPSRYLFSCLRAAGLGPNRFCIVSEAEPGLEPSGYWATTRLVAVTERSSAVLRSLGLDHDRLPHPDDVRETAYKEMLRYGLALAGRGGFDVAGVPMR